MSRFYFDWSSGTKPAPGVSLSWLDSLPQFYANAEPGSLLHKSIEALAHANYGKRCGSPAAIEAGSELYGEALRIMRETIISDVQITMRGALASVVLLGIYEAIVDPSISPLGSWLSHVGGSTMLMMKHPISEHGPQSPIDLQIRNMIFRQMQHGSLMAGRCPAIVPEQLDTIEDPRLQPIQRHRDLVHQATLLCSEWNTALGDMHGPSGLEKLADVATNAIALDEKFELWANEVPPPFGYSLKPITGVKEAPEWLRRILVCPGSPTLSHDYTSSPSEMLWRFYWATRMIISQALVYTDGVLRSQGAASNPIYNRREAVESTLAHVVQRLCESCVTPLVQAWERSKPGGCKIEEIPSIRGYLMLQVLLTVGLCIDQTASSCAHLDLESRRPWLIAMKDLIQVGLGFSKAAAKIDPVRLRKLPVQLWSMGGTNAGL